MTFLNFSISSSSPIISYQGQWLDGPTVNGTCASNPLQQQGTRLTTSEEGAMATLTFLGTNITLFGTTNNGYYFFKLDNEDTLNTSVSPPNNLGGDFSIQDQDNTVPHTFQITNPPTLKDGPFSLDCFSVGRDIGPPGYNGPISNVTIDDESPFIVYNGSWSSFFSPSSFNNSVHSTSNVASKAELQFQGSSIELYGNGASFQVRIDNQTPINLVGPQFQNGNSPSDDSESSQLPSTLLFYTDNLDENKTHIMTLTNSQSALLFLDFAIIRGNQSTSVITSNQNPSLADHAKSIPIGAIIGGAIGGFIIFCLIGLYLRRRRRIHKSRRYRSTVLSDDSVDAEDTPTSDAVTPVVEVTPYMKVAQASGDASNSNPINNSEFGFGSGESNQVTGLNGPEMDSRSPQVPALFTLTNSGIVESNSQHQNQLATTSEPNAHFQNISDRSREEYLVDQVRERDAGRVTITVASSTRSRLPPAYDESWWNSYRPLPSRRDQDSNRD